MRPSVAAHLADIEQHAVDQAARLHQELTAELLQFLFGGPLAQQQPGRHAAHHCNRSHPAGNLPTAFAEQDHSRRHTTPRPHLENSAGGINGMKGVELTDGSVC